MYLIVITDRLGGIRLIHTAGRVQKIYPKPKV